MLPGLICCYLSISLKMITIWCYRLILLDGLNTKNLPENILWLIKNLNNCPTTLLKDREKNQFIFMNSYFLFNNSNLAEILNRIVVKLAFEIILN